MRSFAPSSCVQTAPRTQVLPSWLVYAVYVSSPIGRGSLALDDPQIGPLGRRPGDGVAVARKTSGNGASFLRELGLPRFPDRRVDKLDVVVVSAVDHEAGLHIVEAAALGRDRQPSRASRRHNRRCVPAESAPRHCCCRRTDRRPGCRTGRFRSPIHTSKHSPARAPRSSPDR